MIGTGAREWHPTTWQLWAKSGEEGRWLSIPQHMRDSSAVAGLLWDHWVSDSLRNLLVAETGLASSEVKVLLQWLAGVHDVGKIDPEFIRQLENQSDYSWLVDKARDADLDFRTKPTRGAFRILMSATHWWPSIFMIRQASRWARREPTAPSSDHTTACRCLWATGTELSTTSNGSHLPGRNCSRAHSLSWPRRPASTRFWIASPVP